MKYIKLQVENKEVEDDGEKCVCREVVIEEHTCPFKEEINDDYESLCNCCEYCTQNCRWEI